MYRRCWILFYITVHTVSAGIVPQPIDPFETDVTNYKLVEEFYPENDRNAIPVWQWEKHPDAIAAEYDFRRADSNPHVFSTSRMIQIPYASIGNNLMQVPGRVQSYKKSILCQIYRPRVLPFCRRPAPIFLRASRSDRTASDDAEDQDGSGESGANCIEQ